MRILGVKSPGDPQSRGYGSPHSRGYGSPPRRKKRPSALQKLIHRCHLKCVNCSSDTLSVTSDVQYHSLIDAPMYLPHNQPQGHSARVQDEVEDENLEYATDNNPSNNDHLSAGDHSSAGDHPHSILSLFSSQRNSSPRRYPRDDHLLLSNEGNDDEHDNNIHDEDELSEPEQTANTTDFVFSPQRLSWISRISRTNQNIGGFGNLFGEGPRTMGAPFCGSAEPSHVLSNISHHLNNISGDTRINNNIRSRLHISDDETSVLQNQNNDLVMTDYNTESSNDEPIMISQNRDDEPIMISQNLDNEPIMISQNLDNEPIMISQNHDNDLIIGDINTGLQSESSTDEPTTTSQSHGNDLVNSDLNTGLHNTQLSPHNNRYDMELLSLFDNENETSDLLIDSTRSSTLIDFMDNFTIERPTGMVDNQLNGSNILTDSSHNVHNDRQETNSNESSLERQLPIHLLSLFESESESRSTNEVPEHVPLSLQRLFGGPAVDNTNNTHQTEMSMSNPIEQRLNTVSEQRINTTLPTIPRPLPNLNQQTNIYNLSNRSSSNGSDTRSPLHQNWYIYDPRLVPGNRQDRLNLHMVWRGIQTDLSVPAMIGPPAYDELSSYHDDDDISIPNEPPPPYMENIEVSPIPPPPTYDEAVFNSHFADFERENLALGSQSQTPVNGGQFGRNNLRNLPNYRPLIIQNSESLTRHLRTLENNSENSQTDGVNNLVNIFDEDNIFQGISPNDNTETCLRGTDSSDVTPTIQRDNVNDFAGIPFGLCRYWNRPRWNPNQSNATNFGISCRLRNINSGDGF